MRKRYLKVERRKDMTVKMLDAVGMVVVAIVITKSLELYGEYKYNKGFKEGEKK